VKPALTREEKQQMQQTRKLVLGAFLSVAAIAFGPHAAFAQVAPTTAPVPAKSTVKADMVPSLIVMNARGAGRAPAVRRLEVV
jgi:hypothetical protein